MKKEAKDVVKQETVSDEAKVSDHSVKIITLKFEGLDKKLETVGAFHNQVVASFRVFFSHHFSLAIETLRHPLCEMNDSGEWKLPAVELLLADTPGECDLEAWKELRLKADPLKLLMSRFETVKQASCREITMPHVRIFFLDFCCCLRG